MVHGPQHMPSDTKEVQHDAVHRREPLQLGGRLEALHLAFRWRVILRYLGAIIRILTRPMDHRRHHRAARGRVTAELVGEQPARDAALALQQFSEEPGGGAPIPSRLDQGVEDVAVLVDRMGDKEAALPLYEEDMRLARRIKGSEHPETLTSIASVGIVRCELGRLGEGLPLLREAAAGGLRRLG